MSLKWRAIVATLILIGVIVKVAPNLFTSEVPWWPAHGKIVYGLDIQGGVHLVMGVDTEAVMREKLNRTMRSLSEEFKTAEIPVKEIAITNEKNFEMKIVLASAADETKARDLVERDHKNFLQILSSSDGEIKTKVYDTQVAEMRKQVLDQAIGVIRNRIDEFGVAEPSIQAQGDNRILVQLPGIKDSVNAKALINRTARLEFKIVSHDLGKDQAAQLEKMVLDVETEGKFSLGQDNLNYASYLKKINEALKGKLPANTTVAFEKAASAKSLEGGKVAYLLKSDTNIGGDLLEDAFVSYDERGRPQVAFRFGAEGGRRFGDLTEANVGQLLAIVLDDVVQSAPVIQSKIGNQGVINLSRGSIEETFNEAKFLATTLRAGALPAALEQLEERTVGPTLGADAIAKAKTAGLVVFVAITAFMTAYYGWIGLVSGLALGLNIICLLAVLTGLGATLTLPGVAGMILTMGMAIDSNVIIFERIRDEFRKGSSWKLAVSDGFHHAYSAIFDANLVGAGVAMILYYYGTGPVRGFAVTLLGGIATSMFTAVFLSRVVIELLGDRLHWKRAAQRSATV